MTRLGRATAAVVVASALLLAPALPASSAERWTRAQAAEEYLEAVCPGTLTGVRLADLVRDPDSTQADLVQAAREARDATWRGARKMLDGMDRWPTYTRSTALRVADALIMNNRAYYRLSLQSSRDSFIAFYRTNPFSESVAPQRMRLLLHMKPYWVDNAGCTPN